MKRRQISVRKGKGDKDRATLLPALVRQLLEDHIRRVTRLHEEDLKDGFGEVYLPEALARKYPNAARETGWQYVFPAQKRSIDPRSGKERRHHVMESGLQKAVKTAVGRAGISKPATCHTLRHSLDSLAARLAHPCGASRCSRIPFAVSRTAQVPHICWRTVMTSAPSKTCWATPA